VTWLRLEGSSRDPELTEGLTACIADPLWTLARQLQVGEFHGEDAASPILVEAAVAFAPLTAFAAGDASTAGPVDRADADRPLEVLVEQESAEDDVRLRLELGWILVRAFAELGVSRQALGLLQQRYPVTLAPPDGLDLAGRAQLELLARCSIDGLAAAAELTAAAKGDAVFDAVGLAGGLRAGAALAVAQWLDVVTEFVREPTVARSWSDGPLEYRFRVGAPAAGGELTLDASEYKGGPLDWYHFRRVPDADPLGAGGKPGAREIMVLPAPLRFNGMPAARFWAIEDDTVSFGDLVGGPEDLVRAIVGGYAAVYEDDWLSVPCVLPAGCLARVVSLIVRDDYGARHEIPATAVRDGPGRVWRFFEIEGDDGPDAEAAKDRLAPLLLLAPALPDSEEGPPLERVDFIRDQVANLAWGIERRAVVASGRPADRDASAVRPTETTPAGDAWTYQAYTPVPENWIPFVPVRLGDGASAQVHLRRARVAVPPPGLTEESLLPLGKLLDAGRPLRINEEAIPESGIRVDRHYLRARGADGRVHLWIGRRVRLGAWPATGRFTTDRLEQSSGTGG
jgi:hypothetical protein